MDAIWWVVIGLCAFLAAGGFVAFCFDRVEKLQQIVKAREADCVRLKAKLKRRKSQLMKALVKLEYGKQ